MSSKNHHTPYISIIIPVYNDSASLREVLAALNDQSDYPSARFEVIVVDNGSGDEEYNRLKQLDGIQLLRETEHLNSPYSARNRGVERAKGEIIAFIDATCIPSQNWLRAAVGCLLDKQADMMGGNVSFDFGSQPTAGKILDSLTSVRIEHAIRKRNVAYTANILARKEVFERIGLFPEGIRSGGDVRWTRAATKSGFKLVYCGDAEISKKARSLKELIRKKWRTASYQAENWKETGETESYGMIVWNMIKPPRPNRLSIGEKVDPDVLRRIGMVRSKVWLSDYLIRIVEGFGKLYGKMKARY